MKRLETFDDKLDDWVTKVKQAYYMKLRTNEMVDTYSMIADVDKIIAEAFKHDTVLKEESNV